MNVGQVFLVLSLIATAMSIDCVQNYASSSVVTWHATEAVGQYFAGSRITYNQFIGAALTRADSNPISGTAYIIPGQSTNVSAAIWSSPFSSSTNLVFANGTVPLVYGGPYTLVWVRDATGNDTDLNQAGDWISNSVGLYSATFTDPDFAGQFCFNFLPNNNIPSHSVRGIGAFSANYSQVNAQQGVRINQGTNGINLIIYVNDTDLAPANSTGIINFTATVNTVSSASGSGYGYLYLSSSETPYVTVNENSNFLISLSGTLANIQACVARISVRWTPLEIMTFRVTINVNDNGNYGGCGGAYPCPLWTQSRTEFRTSVTGT